VDKFFGDLGQTNAYSRSRKSLLQSKRLVRGVKFGIYHEPSIWQWSSSRRGERPPASYSSELFGHLFAEL
jgi:hypothetical protein